MMMIGQVLSAHLHEEVLLAHVLQVSRAYLYAYPERILSEKEYDDFIQLKEKYKKGVPISYLTGRTEFWSLDLIVTEDTLIPRHETELLIEQILDLQKKKERCVVADLGTGSGAIALALASQKPCWLIYAVDLSQKALDVAIQNANRLKIKNIRFLKGNWCDPLPELMDIIVANPPYVALNDPHMDILVSQYEPFMALFSEEEGLKDLKRIINEAPYHLQPGGFLFVEHGFTQGERIRKFFAEVGYTDIKTEQDLSRLERMTRGRLPLSGLFGICSLDNGF